MEYFRSYDGYCYTDAWTLRQYCFRFGAIEATYYWLVSALVPEDPASPLALRAVPPHFVRSVEIDPAPALPDNPGAFTNYATPPASGVSWVSGATTWRLKLLWADDVASWPESAEVLGYDAQGQLDRSPRVVKVCPGQEYGPGFTRFPFGPNELRHPSIYHCPGWNTFDDPSLH
jgi:hypothetical protein